MRLAALCHDIGPLAFSHAPEDLLPKGVTHEDLTRILIMSPEMKEVWDSLDLDVRPERVAKLAVGREHAGNLGDLTDWEAILSEIITGDAFGVDRMDYLVRDAHHTGAAYGRFDYYRLIDTLRILTPPPEGDNSKSSQEPSLGIEFGGLAAAEAMLLSRYYMFRTVYFHPVSRIYSVHLQDFLREHRGGEPFRPEYESHLKVTDNEVLSALAEAARDSKKPGHEPACKIAERGHFKVLYEWSQKDARQNVNVTDDVYQAASREFGEQHVRIDRLPGKGRAPDFSVQLRDRSVSSARTESQILAHIPPQKGEYVFIDPSKLQAGQKWLKDNFDSIITNPGSVDDAES